MHARNRSPGNVYRSNAMGMGGVATASRISPESSMRGHKGYNSEHRGYSRGGFGRGQPRQFHRSQPLSPPPQKGDGDVFMEAGKLATEYLVSKGLLPANVLSGKWPNCSLKNRVGAQEGDSARISLEGRTSVLSRLGGIGADIGPGRRRYTDEYNSTGSRSSFGGRRRNGSFKNYGSDWSRDFGRIGSWSERYSASMEAEDVSDVLSRHRDDQQVNNDGDTVSQNSVPESAPQSDVGGAEESDMFGDTQSASEIFKSVDDAGAKASASTSAKVLLPKTGAEPTEKDDAKLYDTEAEEFKDGGNNDEVEQQNTKDDTAITASSEEESLESKNNGDLLKLSHFSNVPTRTCSSMVVRGSKADPMIVDEETCEGEPPKESGAHDRDFTINKLSRDGSSEQMCDSEILNLDNPKVPAPENESGLSCSLVQGICTESAAFIDGSSVKKHVLPEFGGINSMIMEHGEKRALNRGNTSMGSKKPRESASFEDVESDGHLSLLEPLDMRQTSEEPMTSEGRAVILPSEEKRLLDISLYPKDDVEPCMEYTEEKQLFPGSFKTCDLNLMETSDANENQDTDPILIFPSDRQNGKQAIPVDIDLSMSNNLGKSDRFGKCSVDGKDIEVIDLENDSAQEDKHSNSDRRTENFFSGLGGFSNNAHNANDVPDVQDGYGLMISELLGNDIPNCSSVPADMNLVHNDMGLHNGEGILGDDDSIYMSLGEIPISFLRVWEQPTQEYGKPY